MLDSRNRKSGCEFGGAVIDYVYGELSDEASKTFAAHLESCADCRNESADLATISKAVGEWKAREFDGLATPRIDMPNLAESDSSGPAAVRVSWLDGLRDLFASYSLAFRTAAAVLLVAFVAGLGWVYLGGRTAGDGMAGNDPDQKSPPVQNESRPNDDTRGPELADAAREKIENEDGNAEKESAPPRPLPVISTVDNGVKKRVRPRQRATKKVKKKKPAGTQAPSSPEPEISPIDRLTTLATSEETEDEGLRLIELFEDSGSDDR